MEPPVVNLINPREFIAYKTAVQNISAYHNWGFRSVTIVNDSFRLNVNYGWIALICDIFKAIFNSKAFEADSRAKRTILEHNYRAVNEMHDRLRTLDVPELRTHLDPLDIYFSVRTAEECLRECNVMEMLWNKRSLSLYFRKKCDQLTGYELPQQFNLNVRGPFNDLSFANLTPRTQPIDKLSMLRLEAPSGVMQFISLYNEFTNITFDHLLTRCSSISETSRTPKPLIDYCLSVIRLYEDKDLLIKMIEACLNTIQAKGKKYELFDWLTETLPIYRAISDNYKNQAAMKYRDFFVKCMMQDYQLRPTFVDIASQLFFQENSKDEPPMTKEEFIALVVPFVI